MTHTEILIEQIEERRFYWLPFLRKMKRQIESNSGLKPRTREIMLRQQENEIAKFEAELASLEAEAVGIPTIAGGVN